jgi:glutamyl-tRNA synthetase
VSVRVRYAPSPTGNQHIGGVRTAIFNYFFARANKGKFILRIEDTDQSRYKEDALKDIYDTFAWLGIHWDEGPDIGGKFASYFQSQRKEIYVEYAHKLVEKGAAYYCFCTGARLDELRKTQAEKKLDPGYDRRCRNLGKEEQAALGKEVPSPVIRLKVPLEGSTIFHDELLGDIKTDNKSISPDPVLLKSDGFPTYHLANVIDDHLMEITHILRAQEWLPSVPIHIHIYNAFGWTPPLFCHLPMVMGQDGQKLSKRHGATSIIDFRQKGYLPEALINYISLLGWSYDDTREFFTTAELEELFTIKKLNKAPAVFNYKKLDWFNGMYTRKKTPAELKALILPYLVQAGLVSLPLSTEKDKLVDEIVPLVQERLKTLSDVAGLVRFLFEDVSIANPQDLVPKNADTGKAAQFLRVLKDMLEDLLSSAEEAKEAKLRDKAAELGVKLGDFLSPLRVAITGSTQSPPLFESIKILGKEKSTERIAKAIDILEGKK